MPEPEPEEPYRLLDELLKPEEEKKKKK